MKFCNDILFIVSEKFTNKTRKDISKQSLKTLQFLLQINTDIFTLKMDFDAA